MNILSKFFDFGTIAEAFQAHVEGWSNHFKSFFPHLRRFSHIKTFEFGHTLSTGMLSFLGLFDLTFLNLKTLVFSWRSY